MALSFQSVALLFFVLHKPGRRPARKAQNRDETASEYSPGHSNTTVPNLSIPRARQDALPHYSKPISSPDSKWPRLGHPTRPTKSRTCRDAFDNMVLTTRDTSDSEEKRSLPLTITKKKTCPA
ncbi:uncharacterized protein ColSpa_02310 [Colletotrichum spaethianum]|uniref:Uncharacterized protein n=1 Tax=Colletotrichum spaethianum TaxID=700344 RepID=A0AA37L7N6_9PEZI|nr:uncharacterized protein ColSpa_02310 [Colletotrichum spaethianum]GKT42129.1 hypothetical protein ColSpa_02310 [Colletotrichum spaethianum]